MKTVIGATDKVLRGRSKILILREFAVKLCSVLFLILFLINDFFSGTQNPNHSFAEDRSFSEFPALRLVELNSTLEQF